MLWGKTSRHMQQTFLKREIKVTELLSPFLLFYYYYHHISSHEANCHIGTVEQLL